MPTASRTIPLNRATSLYLDILRPIAAFIVLISHIPARELTGGSLKVMESTGVQAVDIFFVLSGFVIAYVCTGKENDAHSYFISRAARIYSVAVPALILTFLLDRIGLMYDPGVYEGAYQPYTLGLVTRSVLFIGEQWGTHRFPGSNGPYWSLGFEVWYYIAFGALLFLPGKLRWLATALILVFIGPKVALMFPAWLMGVFAYRFISAKNLSERAGWLLFLGSLLLLVVYEFLPHSPLQAFAAVSLSLERLWTTAQDYFLAALCCANIIGFRFVSHRFAAVLEKHARVIRWIAGGTFTLYLMHQPILHLLAAMNPLAKNSNATLILLLTVTPAACYLIAEVTERKKQLWHRLFERLISRPT